MAKKKATKKTKKTKPVKKVTKKAASKKAATKKAAKKTTKAVKKSTPSQAQKPTPVAMAQVGQTLPDFTIEGTSHHQFKLSDHRGKKIVLYFYPKDATPGCTLEGHDFTKLLPEFKAAGAEVYGVSRDDMKSHEKFKEKECFTFELLSDEDEKLCQLFGVIKEKNMYGNISMGIERSTFVIDGEGRLVAEWRGVKVPGHVQEVLEKVKIV